MPTFLEVNCNIAVRVFDYFNCDYYPNKAANWTHIKSIPNTTMLVSLSHSYEYCANMAVYDISQKDRANTIYSFEEALGGLILLSP